MSTDEVYGSIAQGAAREGDPLNPSNPYSASKAAADLLARAYWTTHHLPVLVTRSSNNFGPYQYPEKVIPLFVTNALEDKPLPLYGDGKNVRDWLYVLDNCAAIDLVLRRGGRARSTTSAGAPRWRTSPYPPHPDPARQAGEPDHAGHRPARSRPPLRARLHQDRRARLGPRRDLRRRALRDRGVVPHPRGVVEADQVRRLPPVLPDPVRGPGLRSSPPSRGRLGHNARGGGRHGSLRTHLDRGGAARLAFSTLAPAAPRDVDRRLEPSRVSPLPSQVRRVEPAVVGIRVEVEPESSLRGHARHRARRQRRHLRRRPGLRPDGELPAPRRGRIQVSLRDGRKVPARLIGLDLEAGIGVAASRAPAHGPPPPSATRAR